MIKKGLSIGASGALIASLCCIPPLIIVLFGLGSVSFALSFTKYKYFFVTLSIIFIILAIFLNIRKKGKTCAIDPKEIKRKKFFIIITIITMVTFYIIMQYFILPFLGRLIY